MLERFFLSFLFILLSLNAAIAQEGKTLTVIYTNDVAGETEPCG